MHALPMRLIKLGTAHMHALPMRLIKLQLGRLIKCTCTYAAKNGASDQIEGV